jgi:hypothetical protein
VSPRGWPRSSRGTDGFTKPMNVFNSHRPTGAGDRDERHDRATAIRTQPVHEKAEQL